MSNQAGVFDRKVTTDGQVYWEVRAAYRHVLPYFRLYNASQTQAQIFSTAIWSSNNDELGRLVALQSQARGNPADTGSPNGVGVLIVVDFKDFIPGKGGEFDGDHQTVVVSGNSKFNIKIKDLESFDINSVDDFHYNDHDALIRVSNSVAVHKSVISALGIDKNEPPRDCRRLQLMSRRSHYEQANEQIFT